MLVLAGDSDQINQIEERERKPRWKKECVKVRMWGGEGEGEGEEEEEEKALRKALCKKNAHTTHSLLHPLAT